MIVVDVNVIAYLLVTGEHTEMSEELLIADAHWAAPILWRSEWRHVLAGYVRRGQLDQAGALARIELAEGLVRGREHVPEGGAVMNLVARSTCSAYDCEYVSVAEMLGVPLVTNDRRILGEFPNQALSPAAFVGRQGA